MSLLEQVQNLSFEDREQIVFELKKKPEKKPEEHILEELKQLTKKIEKIENDISTVYALILVSVFFFVFMQSR